MNEVNWADIIITKNITNSLKITKNALTCESCTATCCANSSSENCGCWFPYGCQKCNSKNKYYFIKFGLN
jgi:hypothetical protein